MKLSRNILALCVLILFQGCLVVDTVMLPVKVVDKTVDLGVATVKTTGKAFEAVGKTAAAVGTTAKGVITFIQENASKIPALIPIP